MRFDNKNVILPEPWVQPGPFNDEIWYTSSDGNIVTPRTSALPTILSNTYIDGKGVIKCASDITSIGTLAFNYCTSLISITIPNSVTSIGSDAFEECYGLTSVNISNNITSIEYDTFSNCESLISIIIGNNVTTIGSSAFYYCISLTSINIPNSVTSIGSDAFEECSSLTSVHIIDLAAWYNIDFGTRYSNPLYYAHNLYLNGELITDLVIPNSVTNIRSYAFYNCESLTSIEIPNSVTSIEEYAFYDCSDLTSISYTGTIAQYNAVTKGEYWHYNVPTTVVHCTDGDTTI